jgi:flagellar biosynthetic protein FliQ
MPIRGAARRARYQAPRREAGAKEGSLNEIDVLEVGRDAMLVVLLVGGPIMAVGMVVGLAISLFQALTTIQEMTLTFVPKIVCIFVAVVVLLPFMMSTLIEFSRTLFDRISVGG